MTVTEVSDSKINIYLLQPTDLVNPGLLLAVIDLMFQIVHLTDLEVHQEDPKAFFQGSVVALSHAYGSYIYFQATMQ
jgi:hypothetical protein